MAIGVNEEIYHFGVKVVNQSNEPIQNATVTFYIDGTLVDREFTDAQGRATYIHSILRSQEEPQYDIENIYCTCNVSARGYVGVEDVDVELALGTIITLTPIEGKYYYKLKVSDKNTGSSIKNATVSQSSFQGAINYTEVGTTDKNGNFTYENETYNRLYFKVSKIGYADSDEISIDGEMSIENTLITFVELNPEQVSDYYYVIAAKDQSGKPVEGVKVRLYKDFSKASTYGNEFVTLANADDEIFYIVCEIISDEINIDESLINLEDTFDRKLGLDDSEKENILNKVNERFNTSDILNDSSTITTVGELVNYIKTHSSLRMGLCKTIYTTDSNGLISIPFHTLSTSPSKIFAEGIRLPVDSEYGNIYTWADDKHSGDVYPSIMSDTPSLTLNIKSYVSDTYYYNFQVFDQQTKQPVSQAEVVYTDEDENVLVRKYTSSDGMVKYSSKIKDVYVTIIKDGYDGKDLRTKYPSCQTVSNYYTVYLKQGRSVYVVDEDNNPLSGINLWICYNDKNGKQFHYNKTYRTYDSGYADVITDEVYTMSIKNNAYFRVINYKVSSENKNKLIKYITSTEVIVIRLPKESEDNYSNIVEGFNENTVNNIKKKISSLNNSEVEFKTVGKDDIDFKINIVDPDTVSTYDIFTCIPVIMNNNQKSVVGSVDMDIKSDINDLKIKKINRYSGYYNPIFKDILFYKNYTAEKHNHDQAKCPYSNTMFDVNYKDDIGKFGIIDHMWFHKVNDNKDVKIINIQNPLYPLTGQYAIDNREYNIFESNWDADHYKRQTGIDTFEDCRNITSMKEGLCMFGSKYLNVPEKIEICGFSLGDEFDKAYLENANSDNTDWKNELNWNGEWNDDWITNPDGCPGEVMFKEVNDNSINFYFFFKKRILRYFREKLKDEFEKYISSEYSFGKPGIDDDIDEYVTKNVLNLYKFDKIRIFVRRIKKGQHNSKIENDYTKYLKYIKNQKTEELVELEKDNLGYFKSHEFVEVNNATMTKINTDDFDRKLVYNLRSGTQEYFGFSFILKKI